MCQPNISVAEIDELLKDGAAGDSSFNTFLDVYLRYYHDQVNPGLKHDMKFYQICYSDGMTSASDLQANIYMIILGLTEYRFNDHTYYYCNEYTQYRLNLLGKVMLEMMLMKMTNTRAEKTIRKVYDKLKEQFRFD